MKTDQISTEDAQHALFHFTGEEGVQPGTFLQGFFELLKVADDLNTAKLAREYPGWVQAYKAGKTGKVGLELLRDCVRHPMHMVIGGGK